MADYILNMGGSTGTGGYLNAVDVFKETSSGVEKIINHGLSLSVARMNLSSAHCGNYILAMGGYDGSGRSNTVDVFKVTESGIEHITDHGLSLSVGRGLLAAASCGNYIFAMGGDKGSSYSNAVDVFKVTSNGVEQVTNHGLSLSVARDSLSAASAGSYVLAMGGDDINESGYTDTVDVFQINNKETM